MYVLKHCPEDFVVRELSSVVPSSGSFLLFRLWKRDLSMFEAIRRLASFFGVPVSFFSYAGIKDRCAVSEQVCSVRGVSKEHLSKFVSSDLKVEFLGFRSEPVHVGELDGNFFRVVVRGIDVLPKMNSRFRNLFGDQRFSKNNVELLAYSGMKDKNGKGTPKRKQHIRRLPKNTATSRSTRRTNTNRPSNRTNNTRQNINRTNNKQKTMPKMRKNIYIRNKKMRVRRKTIPKRR